MKQTTFFLLALFALFASACSGGNTSLEGAWTLNSYGHAANPTPALPGIETSITFDADGKFGGTVGCNTFGGDYKINGDKATFSGAFSTMMYCQETDEQERAVLSLISEQTMTFSVSGNQLTLTSEDGASVIILTKK
ncbi:MAG: hypothetical protein KPEEDBHJ_01680 [Anaerolineales bacterium]|nr:hypothetical protein [Anaerolineales bacterium]MCK6568590.1 META domain-containing protein [Anaerolineales bacterium]NUQ60324.1 META domain-containing protein [Anaerolineales bacterium]